jgi:ubiquinone/menaquinone biosynthesis C-methylase UbiE
MQDINDRQSKIYRHIFPEEELSAKEVLWKILIDVILQKYIKDNDTVLDIGGGQCLFINNIKCGKKFANDLNPDITKYADKDVVTIHERADNLSTIGDASINVVFASNFFEHMKDKDELERVIAEIKRVLTLNGLILVIQPNIRYAYKEYWDVLDHYIPISDKSLTDLLMINNFKIIKCYPRFMPWSPKHRLSRFTFLLKIYLRMPLIWPLFGKQLFVAAQKTQD